MKIYFGNEARKIYLIIYLIYLLIDIKHENFLRDINSKSVTENKEKKKYKYPYPYNIIIGFTSIVFMTILTVLLIFIIKQYEFFAYIFSIATLLFFAIPMFYAVFILIKYFFRNPSDYKLSSKVETSLKYMMFILFIFFLNNQKITSNNLYYFLYSKNSAIMVDMKKAIIMIMWYYLWMFSVCLMIMLSIEKGIYLLKRKKKVIKIFKSLTRKEIQKPKEIKFDYLETLTKAVISDTLNKPWYIKIYYNLKWFIGLLANITYVFFVLLIKILIFDVYYFIKIILSKSFNYTISKLNAINYENLGRGIVLASRIYLAISLLIVYGLDKYIFLFSSKGSVIYEYFASVIIIPLILTSVIDIKNKKT